MNNKVCSKCGTEKPLDEFYFQKRKYSEKPYPWCKECHREQSRKIAKTTKNSKLPINADEIDVVNLLKSRGIYASSGKASDFKRIDVVAWGCVPIEVKKTTVNAQGEYWFYFSPNNSRYGTKAEVLVWILVDKSGSRSYHVFPISHPMFHNESGLRIGVGYKPGANYIVTDQIMRYYKDAWDIIEDKRVEIAEKISQNNEA